MVKGLALLLSPTIAYGLANSMFPLPEYKFSWTADTAQHKLSVELVLTPPASTTVGWVGFGIAGGGGGMLGADVFTAYSTGAATCQLDDRLATAKALPGLDTANNGFSDWQVDSCSLASGVLTVAATRAFVTYDSQDLAFVSGPMELVFAWGKTTPTSPSSITFHDGNYVTKLVSLWGPPVEVFNKSALESDYDTVVLNMTNAAIGPDTTYLCQGFDLTQKNNQSTQAIVFEPIVAPLANEPYVHHMVLYLCNSSVQSTAFRCESMPAECKGILYAWGKGGNPMILPNVTGVELGTSGRMFAALQMHYNNPDRVTGLVDASGIRIYRTNQIRATQSGMFMMGTGALNLPPQRSVYTVGAICPSSVTNVLPAAGVTAYASFLHAHQRGRRMWTELSRGGTVIATVGNNQNYDFNLQKVQSLFPAVAIKRGDVLTTYCTYDTSNDTTTVTFGETTANEMCFNFIAYYPLLGTQPTYGCGVTSSYPPSATACALLPDDPPAAYNVTNFTTIDTVFKTGGTARCSNGFSGTAVLGCVGNGAPFTFSGCVRATNGTSPTPSNTNGTSPTPSNTNGTNATSSPTPFTTMSSAFATASLSVAMIISLVMLA